MSLKVQFVEKTLKAANTSLYYLLGYRIFAAMKFESVRNNFSADWISVQPVHTAAFYLFFVWSMPRYSEVPNKQADRNKRADCHFLKIHK